MFAHTVFQTSINQPTPTLPLVRRKNTLLGLKVKNTRKEELSTKNALDVNVRARRPAPIITRAQFVLVEEVEREVAAVSADRVQRQMAISLDCLEGRRPENLETSSDWDTLLFLEDIGEMKTAVPVVRSAFSVSYSEYYDDDIYLGHHSRFSAFSLAILWLLYPAFTNGNNPPAHQPDSSYGNNGDLAILLLPAHVAYDCSFGNCGIHGIVRSTLSYER